MSRIKVILNPLDDTQVAHLRTDNVIAVFSEIKKKHAQARIYIKPASQQTDVTPTNVVDIASLQMLANTHDFDIVCHAGEAITVIAVVSLVVSVGLAVYTYMNMPDLNQGQQGSGNNELVARVNKERINARIPDIFGTVKAYPDLIAPSFEFYENNQEIEECVMCLGRGWYSIKDVQESGNAVESIEGMSVSVYNPNSNITELPFYRSGEILDQVPVHAVKSRVINGQSLETPTSDIMSQENDLQLYFTSLGEIRKFNTSFDFANYFSENDRIAIVGAEFLGSNQLLTGQTQFNQDNQIVITREYNLTNFNDFEKITVTGANLYKDIVTIDEGTLEESTERAYFDLSGIYSILDVVKTQDGNEYTYTITLQNPEYINPNWSIYFDVAYSTYCGLELIEPKKGIDLDGYYTISAVSRDSITLANPSVISQDWEKIAALPGANSLTLTPENPIRLEIVDNKWVGWYDLVLDGAKQCVFNIIMPQGISNVTNKGAFTHAFVNIEVQCEAYDSSDVKIGPTLSRTIFIEDATRDAIGRTLRLNLPDNTHKIRFRSAKISAQTRNNPITETKLKSVYLTKPLEKLIYDDLTMVRTKTPATKGALSLKERKLSMIATRKVFSYASGSQSISRIPSSNFADIVCALHTDPFIGRRDISTIDLANLYSASSDIRAYFGTSKVCEFNYTFDQSNTSYEESITNVASMVFSNPRRLSDKVFFQFEKENPNSCILFNHRNKKPGTETRTEKYISDNEYDGIEATWVDPSQDWTDVKIMLPNDLINNPKKIELTGVTNAEQAHLLAHRAWNKIKFQRETVQFTAYGESDLVTLNDRIAITDDTVPSLLKLGDATAGYTSGEIVRQDVRVIEISDPVWLDETKEHVIHLQMPSRFVETMRVSQGVDEFHLLLERLPIQPLVVNRVANTVYSITSDINKDVEAYLVSEKSPSTSFESQVVAINYDRRYYENDKDIINNLI